MNKPNQFPALRVPGTIIPTVQSHIDPNEFYWKGTKRVKYSYSHVFEIYSERAGRPLETPEQLREYIRTEDFTADGIVCARNLIDSIREFTRWKRMGSLTNPGKLTLFVFPELKPAKDQRIEKAILWAGDGI